MELITVISTVVLLKTWGAVFCNTSTSQALCILNYPFYSFLTSKYVSCPSVVTKQLFKSCKQLLIILVINSLYFLLPSVENRITLFIAI